MRNIPGKLWYIGMLLVSHLLFAVFSAGCVTSTPEPLPSENIPPEMAAVLQDVTTTLSGTASRIQKSLFATAKEIVASSSDTGEIEKILRNYAENNYWITIIPY